jgi:predicted nucleotidyltransferase
VDYLHPLVALIPGARGRVVEALTTNTNPQSIRQVAKRAGVSASRAGQILEDLTELGITEEQVFGSQVLVRLAPNNVTASVLSGLADQLQSKAVLALRQEAEFIKPAPINLTLFGSFARSQARRGSDVDVVVVRPEPEDSPDHLVWMESMAKWVEAATRITGNPLHLIELDADELRGTLSPWLREVEREGMVLAGYPLRRLLKAAHG